MAKKQIVFTNSESFVTEENNNKVVITEYIGNEKIVVVPPTINGKKVVAIDDAAFKNNRTIEQVSLEHTEVTTIGADAFNGCINLRKVGFPESLKEIGDAAFRKSGVKKLGIGYRVQSIGYECFAFCPNLQSVDLKGFIGTIGDRCFYMCMNLHEVENLNPLMEEIGKEAFSVGRRIPNDPLWDVTIWNARIRLI